MDKFDRRAAAKREWKVVKSHLTPRQRLNYNLSIATITLAALALVVLFFLAPYIL